jgi:enoyl-CoA hydratase
MPDDDRLRYERPHECVARLVLARPELGNAQDKRMIYELNEGFERACADDSVKVILLAADGPDFSTGHVLRAGAWRGEHRVVSCWGGFDAPGIEGLMAREEEWYVNMCWRWRNIPKVTVAAVQGRVVAGGLMFIWPCDLIVAATDTTFCDPVVGLGLNGQEYFAHLWELGARRAKDILFTGRAITADEALTIGMVSRVVEPASLQSAALELAIGIASRSMMGLKLAKQAVNQSQDAQGLWSAIQAAYSTHLLGHSNNMHVHGSWVDPAGVPELQEAMEPRPS